MVLTGASLVIAVLIVGGGAAACAWSAPRYNGPKTDHFDGKVFHNPAGRTLPGIGAMLRWQIHRDTGPWKDWTDASPGAPPPKTVADGSLRVTFVNHATTLVQLDGVN